jgi:hypothetical protein
MPKKYNQVKEKKIKLLLTSQQIKIVDDVGDFIDEQIELVPSSNYVKINECIIQFECDHLTLDPILYPEPERSYMADLLITRFTDAQWRFSVLDGYRTFFMRDF